MKPQLAKAIFKDCKDRGYIEHNGVFYPPSQYAMLSIAMLPKKKKVNLPLKKTGDIYDDRNIRNKAKQTDMFMMLIKKHLNLDLWPEFFFSTERLYRLDYALPLQKISVEVNGGIHMAKGGHNSAKGLLRDYEKGNLLQSLGWKTISVTPDQLMTNYTVDLIKKLL